MEVPRVEDESADGDEREARADEKSAKLRRDVQVGLSIRWKAAGLRPLR